MCLLQLRGRSDLVDRGSLGFEAEESDELGFGETGSESGARRLAKCRHPYLLYYT